MIENVKVKGTNFKDETLNINSKHFSFQPDKYLCTQLYYE